jgi:SAM-dependent methyltransferase
MLYNFIPKSISNKLFGNREKWGKVPNLTDPCWVEWEAIMPKLYEISQRKGIGKTINEQGYKIFKNINLDNNIILEIGAGDLGHTKHWQGTPKEYILVERRQELLKQQARILENKVIAHKAILNSKPTLPIEDESVDILVSFYSLEHLHPLSNFMDEIMRVLKPGGKLIGAIPAEGGLAWGIGRYLTTRRWFLQNTSIDPDKIICWEHPNFANKVISTAQKRAAASTLYYWPFKVPIIDINLVISFIFQK